jgi:hypothetical protein
VEVPWKGEWKQREVDQPKAFVSMSYLGFRCEGRGTALHTYDVGGDWEWGSVMEV